MSNELWYVRDRNKVTGPFNRDQLEALRRRGQLARFHQVSQDRRTWAPATSLTGLFAPLPTASIEVEPGSAAGAQPPQAVWYYSAGQTPVGPVSSTDLLALLKGGTIDQGTLVWREGMPTWLAIRDAEFDPLPATPGGRTTPASPAMNAPIPPPTARRTRRSRLKVASVAGATIAALALALGLSWGFPKGGGKPGQGSALSRNGSRFTWLGGKNTIDSVVDNAELSSAVGLVVCGWTLTEFDGTKTDCCLSTGTCFAVSEDGYLLTNRHVVDEISKFINADRMRRALEEKTKAKLEPRIWVFFKHQKYLAAIQYESDEFDLAVLKIKPTQRLSCFHLASSDDSTRGTPVYALGFPGASRMPLSQEQAVEQFVRAKTKGVKIDFQFKKSNLDYTITDGIISLVKQDGHAWKIEHTARISGGNSGGPLVTADGTVVGINTLLMQEAEGSVPTFVAIAVAQLQEELSRNVPELLR